MANGEWSMGTRAMADGTINSFKDLEVWQMAMSLAADCYRLTAQLPREEAFGLSAQIRRASVSIPANIAEGHGRETTGSFVQFLRVAQGSTKELETLLLLARDVELLNSESTEPALIKIDRIGKMLRSLIRSLQKD
jgi:four helix bundle protein